MAPFIHTFVHHWHEYLNDGGWQERDVLFAVSVLSNGFFESQQDARAYTVVIEDYFADSETDTEYG